MSTGTAIRPISRSLRQLLAETFTATELRAIAATFDDRARVPEALALVLAEELAAAFSKPPLETGEGRLIHNRPTVGWWRRRAQRTAEARAS